MRLVRGRERASRQEVKLSGLTRAILFVVRDNPKLCPGAVRQKLPPRWQKISDELLHDRYYTLGWLGLIKRIAGTMFRFSQFSITKKGDVAAESGFATKPGRRKRHTAAVVPMI